MISANMPLPIFTRCCGCLSLRTGCAIMCVISTLACLANMTVGAWNMPRHHERDPEDNMISMCMIMFSGLSAISNVVTLFGIATNRSGYLQLSQVFNSVFIVFLFLVAIVTCVFRLTDFLSVPGNVALVVTALFFGAAYSFYYITITNSLYRIMKMSYSDSAIPV